MKWIEWMKQSDEHLIVGCLCLRNMVETVTKGCSKYWLKKKLTDSPAPSSIEEAIQMAKQMSDMEPTEEDNMNVGVHCLVQLVELLNDELIPCNLKMMEDTLATWRARGGDPVTYPLLVPTKEEREQLAKEYAEKEALKDAGKFPPDDRKEDKAATATSLSELLNGMFGGGALPIDQ